MSTKTATMTAGALGIDDASIRPSKSCACPATATALQVRPFNVPLLAMRDGMVERTIAIESMCSARLLWASF